MRFLTQCCLIVAIIFLNSSESAAEESFALCKPMAQAAPQRPDLPPAPADGAVQLFADKAEVSEKDGISTFTGDVLMQRADQILKTNTVVYHQQGDKVNADSAFTLWDKDFVVSGQKLRLRPDYRGEMESVRYWLLARRGYGKAETVTQQGKELFHLGNSKYTTCEPGHEAWWLSMNRLTLDNEEAVGTAHHVTVHFFGIPLFYSPYLSFPLNDARKSGFLPPNVGSSDEVGLEMSIPYYWNLAPHYDATITPRLMTKRGLLVNTEFRYLLPASGGTLEAEYLPHDSSFGDSRTSFALRHQGQVLNNLQNLQTDVNFNYVSDSRYFEELGNNLSIASITHLERRGDLLYSGNGWQALGRLQAFQTLDPNPAARPYQRLPQLLVKTQLPERNRQLNTALQGEWVRFERSLDDEQLANPNGNRFDLLGTLSYPWRTAGTFFIPKLSLRYTRYALNQTTHDSDNPQRTLYTVSGDSGAFFEREASWLNTALVQTLEPRLFYRYTPHKDQTEIPVFDTARYDLSFGQLFRDNDFSGTDRIDDGHQITYALTSRLLESQGREVIRASIGQIYYLRDRKVTLPDETIELNDSSGVVVELAAQPTQEWSSSATFRWNPNNGNTEHSVVRLRYQPDKERIFNAGYRLREGILEQTDISGYWSLNRRWSVIGRWNYSLLQSKDLEIFAGLEYESCCWAVRAVARRYLNTLEGDYLNGFFLQFSLKGLGGIGKKADSFLEQSIAGYADRF